MWCWVYQTYQNNVFFTMVLHLYSIRHWYFQFFLAKSEQNTAIYTGFWALLKKKHLYLQCLSNMQTKNTVNSGVFREFKALLVFKAEKQETLVKFSLFLQPMIKLRKTQFFTATHMAGWQNELKLQVKRAFFVSALLSPHEFQLKG